MNGPNRTLAAPYNAAVQLRQTGHSLLAQKLKAVEFTQRGLCSPWANVTQANVLGKHAGHTSLVLGAGLHAIRCPVRKMKELEKVLML